MRLILDIESINGSQQRVWMTRTEVLSIGRSSHADVCVENDPKLAEVHFLVEGGPDGWHLQASRGARVGVNGAGEQRCRLKHGDSIIAGQTEFRVTIEQPPADVVKSDSMPALSASSIPKLPATYQETMVASGVCQFAITLNDTSLRDVLETVAGQAQLWIAINEQRIGGTIPQVEKLTEDLFANAPEEIRATDSLCVGNFPLDDAVLDNIVAASRANGAVLFVSSAPFPEILEQQKITWAWYSRPTILRQQLSLGSKELAKKLLAVIETAVILDGVGCDVLLLARSDVQQSLAGRLSTLPRPIRD